MRALWVGRLALESVVSVAGEVPVASEVFAVTCLGSHQNKSRTLVLVKDSSDRMEGICEIHVAHESSIRRFSAASPGLKATVQGPDPNKSSGGAIHEGDPHGSSSMRFAHGAFDPAHSSLNDALDIFRWKHCNYYCVQMDMPASCTESPLLVIVCFFRLCDIYVALLLVL